MALPLPTNFQRLDPFPLDTTSVFSTYALLTAYADSYPTAYPGQFCAVSGIDVGYIVTSDKKVKPLGDSLVMGYYVPLSGGTLTGPLAILSTLSSSGSITSPNINIMQDRVNTLYTYLVQNFDNNIIGTSSSINQFIASEWSESLNLQPGDTVTLSAINTVYILGNSDGTSPSDYLEVNLKPNYLFYRTGLDDYSALDIFPLSAMKSAKYVLQVEDVSTDDIFYCEVNVVANNTLATATEYGSDYTTPFPFVEFGASIVNNFVVLSAMPLEGHIMTSFIFKGNRTNLF